MNTQYIESWLHDVAFKGMLRKDGVTPMAEHSINVGRLLRERGYDDLTVFTGYYHDVIEDCSENFPGMNINEIVLKQARLFFDENQANDALNLVLLCSYSPEEYEEEKRVFQETGDKLKGKNQRKKMAVERWLNSPLKVRLVKEADVDDNEKSALSVGKEFYTNYTNWAVPFRDELILLRTNSLKM